MNVHLVDGTYVLFRAFYAVPSAKNASGLEVGALRGLARSMLALLREPGVSHVAVAFDHVIESFRNQLFAGYKTGEGIDPDLWGQFELAERVCAALGIVVWPMVEFEADDALATDAFRFAQAAEVEQVLIASPDKDLAQCVVGTRVVCLDRMRKKLLDEAGVNEKFGVTPAQIPDYLALVGDSADGIPGVPRWGAKSAAAVLREYGTIEAIPDSGAARPRWPRACRSVVWMRYCTSASPPCAWTCHCSKIWRICVTAVRCERPSRRLPSSCRIPRFWSVFRNSCERC